MACQNHFRKVYFVDMAEKNCECCNVSGERERLESVLRKYFQFMQSIHVDDSMNCESHFSKTYVCMYAKNDLEEDQLKVSS